MGNASILCTQCGASSETPLSNCAKCAGKNVRVCVGCNFQNSLAKNYCDKCGSPISVLGAVAAPAEIAAIPATAVRKLAVDPAAPQETPAPPVSALPAARQASVFGESATPATGEQWPAPTPPATTSPRTASGASQGSRWLGILGRMAAAAFVTVAVIAALLGVQHWNENNKPEIAVLRAGARYLEALRTRDYAAAYAQFSAAARKHCTLEEFIATRDKDVWTWSSLRVDRAEEGAMLLAYELAIEGAAPRTDRVLFVQEGKNWVRPYSWALLRKVEEAFDRNNPDLGLVRAQAAATIDPRDPMARGYLCEAAYYRKAPTDVEKQCLTAIELSRVYPSNLSLKSLYHLHAILADTYKNALQRPSLALEQYAQMLAFPSISPVDQCEILLARAEAYITLSRPGEALADAERAESLCVRPQDFAFIADIKLKLNAPTQ